jgi:Rieske 2Fe-2S family protein
MHVKLASPAPLDALDLEPVLSNDFGTARTLPARAYTAPEVLDWERRNFFESGWICVGRTEKVARPRNQWAIRVLGLSVLLVRDEDERLHAFHNACRHRGHELLGPGECRTRRHIACPYHSWAFRLDGSLKSATRFSEVPGFDAADYPLRALRVEEWGGWAFLNISGDGPPLADWLGNLAELCTAWDPAALTIQARQEYVVQANWKTIVENYCECYHCPSIHPELCRVSPPDSGVPVEPTGLWIGGHLDLADHADTMSLDGKGSGGQIPALPSDMRRHVYYLALFPNLLISPHPDYLMTHRLEPQSPLQTFVECSWLFHPASVQQPGFDPGYAATFWDITNKQDFAACESVARTLAAGGYLPGPYDYREDAVRSFEALVAEGYRDGCLSVPDVERRPRARASVAAEAPG